MSNVTDNMPSQITLETARLLVSAHAISSAAIVQVGGKWGVFFNGKADAMMLKTARGDPRLFKTLDTAALNIRSTGLGHCAVKLDDWNPQQEGF